MVSVAVRAAAVVLAEAVNETVPAPLPFDGDTLTQLAPLVAVQPQPVVVVTLIDPEPPEAAALTAVGLTARVHVAAAWFTVKVLPAIVSVAVRAVVAEFARTVNATVPEPLPFDGETMTQLEPLAAVHPQPAAVVTVTDPDAPAAAAETVPGDTPKVQLPSTNMNELEGSLRPLPVGPIAATRASYVPLGSGQAASLWEKSTLILASDSGAGLPRSVVWKGWAAPDM
jgi:hypothetical protein